MQVFQIRIKIYFLQDIPAKQIQTKLTADWQNIFMKYNQEGESVCL